MATKERVSSDIDRKLRIEADKKANGLGISRAKLIEIAMNSDFQERNSLRFEPQIRTRTFQRP